MCNVCLLTAEQGAHGAQRRAEAGVEVLACLLQLERHLGEPQLRPYLRGRTPQRRRQRRPRRRLAPLRPQQRAAQLDRHLGLLGERGALVARSREGLKLGEGGCQSRDAHPLVRPRRARGGGAGGAAGGEGGADRRLECSLRVVKLAPRRLDFVDLGEIKVWVARLMAESLN